MRFLLGFPRGSQFLCLKGLVSLPHQAVSQWNDNFNFSLYRQVHVGKTSRWKAKVYCRCDEEELQEAPGPRILDKGELDASLNSTAADVNQNDDTIAVVDGGDRIFIYANEPGGPRLGVKLF